MIAENVMKQFNYLDFNRFVYHLLEYLYQPHDIPPPYVKNKYDISDSFHCFRNFRKTSTTRAIDTNVDEIVTYVLNRWKT